LTTATKCPDCCRRTLKPTWRRKPAALSGFDGSSRGTLLRSLNGAIVEHHLRDGVDIACPPLARQTAKRGFAMAENGNQRARFSRPETVLFTNVRILDGSGEHPFVGEVLIQGNRIKQVTRGASRLGSAGGVGATIDGMGATLMPGLIDAHLHLSWNNAPSLDAIQRMPPEEHTLWAAQMAKLVLDAGFTAGC